MREASRRPRSNASSSVSVTTCTTPERRPCGSGPPRRAASTFSPVTLRTTSGPVTKMRPFSAMMTTSVRAGPYAAPPAAAPMTTEICGILPEARVMMANTSPTAWRLTTPSARRAPPECHRPMIGVPSARAMSYASTMALQPSTPMAPPWTRASEQNTTTGAPFARPRAETNPDFSTSLMISTVSSSRKFSRRRFGSRGSAAGASGAAVRAFMKHS